MSSNTALTHVTSTGKKILNGIPGRPVNDCCVLPFVDGATMTHQAQVERVGEQAIKVSA